MKILVLSKKVPYPLKDGESLAIHYMSLGYAHEGCTVDLLALNTKKHKVEYAVRPKELEHFRNIDLVDIDTRPRYVPALWSLISGGSYNLSRFFSQEYAEKLRALLKSEAYDVIHMETLYMTLYVQDVRSVSDTKVVFRSENLEYEIWENLASGARNLMKRTYFGICARRLKSYELKMFGSYDLLLAISEPDLRHYKRLGYKGERTFARAGIDIDKYAGYYKRISDSRLILGYIGSMDWMPNLEGIEWFFDRAWQRIIEKFPSSVFQLAGRNMPEQYIDHDIERLEVKGEVESAIDFLSGLDVVVIPLFSGSGIRLKIIECMAMGQIVISTPKGYEGIPVKHRKNGFVFENVEELVEVLNWIEKAEEAEIEKIKRNAMSLAKAYLDYKTIAQEVVALYREL